MINQRRLIQRKFTNWIFLGGVILLVALVFVILASLLITLFVKGWPAIQTSIWTQALPSPSGKGGLGNAIVGSFILVGLAIVISAPIAILIATYISEASNKEAWARQVRFINDILLSVPSIILGLFIYILLVRTMGSFSTIAGSCALMLIALPIICRITDDALGLVDTRMKEAAFALGASHFRVLLSICYRSAYRGLITGVLLAIARIAGETAPLLFTVLSNQFWSLKLTAPMANLPVVIFQYVMSPYANWQALAWSGALLITLFILILSIIARILTARSPA